MTKRVIDEYEYTGKAMGSDYSIVIVGDSNATAKEMFAIAKADIENYEARFSRFLPTSELSLLNKQQDMNVSEIFFAVTLQAYELFSKTGGIFNPLVQISRLGYDRTFDEMKTQTSGENFLHNDDSPYDIDFSSTKIDAVNSRIILRDGQRLDFGGFLKGYLAEIIAKKLMSNFEGVLGVIVNLGGDIHTRGVDQNLQNFEFSIYNPVLENEEVIVTLLNQSLATSGTYKRTWQQNGNKTHHILDASGIQNPTTDIVSASVIHESGATAEAFAKVLLAIGYEKASEVLGNEKFSFVTIKSNGEIFNNIL